MKLSLKIPLAFAAALVLMFAGALYGIFALNASIDAYRDEVANNVANERMVSATLVTFKLQVQEWKDTLLRGKDPARLQKYWSAFQTRESAVGKLADELKHRLPAGESRDLIERFASAHVAMGEGYRRGFEAFKAAGFEPSAGDDAVAGVDRQPAALLEQAAKNIAADSARVSEEADRGARRASIASVALMLLVLALALIGGYLFSRTVSRPLARALGCAQAVATGDLSLEFEARGKDEIAELLAALKHMQTSLAQVVCKVRDNAEGVATASAQIASGNLDLSSRTEEQAASLQETAASMEEITAAVRQNADHAADASSLTQNAWQTATSGGVMMEKVVETMHGISDSSSKVGEIISVIDAIAFQTNILALNAAVEAARAGEEGRGFAVVAAEVRSLAQRSASAAKEIKALIEQSAGRVQTGSVLVRDTGAIIADIVGSVQRVAGVVNGISAASEEQRSGIEQVNLAVTQMDEVTQQNAALVEQASAAAQALAGQAASLRDAVAVFRLREDAALPRQAALPA
ncbi:methyl-accepting chemotaxis protein (plasmid) [Burkholderia sp. SFA1]|uniref:methyl-accepting chemotaxis protein n=1 Tax=unclassified Caballeronia TaxID=2646786 RepID=UPI001F2A44F3|nr:MULTISPECIES: methyl-accepting chemotaxis protein [unclassified Caballeronia]MCE4545857.1 methyl-accepting chemotaxis protein [Caballeronia sp. PC1]MCE4572021.1 methyl-accepting chemotaxis protein [Caballeronia sp. CLC5]BBQ01211.1 methyl-accepting chemotaxis protein [Burkholderia sp. SFA1]